MKIEENLYVYYFNNKYILHNVIQSSWILIGIDELELIKKKKYDKLPTVVRNKLKIFRILENVPLEIDKKVFSIPKTAYLVMTNRCNLKCLYCYAEASLDKDYDDILTFKEWIEILNKLKDSGIEKVIFTGGEIGLDRNSLKYIDYANKLGFKIGLITNGTLLRNKKNAKYLSEKCDAITISLDSINEDENDLNRGSGCYNIAMSAISNLIEIGYNNISVNAIITNNNFRSMDQTISFFKKNNISYKLGGFSELGRAKTAEISLSEKQRNEIEFKEKNDSRTPLLKPFHIKESCGLGTGEFAINPRGEVYACKLLETTDYKLGDIRNQSIKEIFNKKNIDFIDSQNITKLEKCNSCSFRYLCGGGCRAHHYFSTSDVKGIDSAECSLIKETLKNQMFRTCTT